MANYSIDTGDGNQLAAGLPEHTAYRTAQRLADERGEAVTLYAEPVRGESEDDGYNSDQQTRTVEPTEIVIDLDSATGPRVTYGAQDEATVDREIPEGYAVDWSNAVNLAPSGTHRIAYSAPLVKVARCECGAWLGEQCEHSGPACDLVTVEWMPEDRRASHVAAGNQGTYPHNGAVRLRVSAECADAICAESGEWATRL